MSNQYIMRVKYPRTPHLPWSPGLQKDNRQIESLDKFIGKRIIITEKMDGENTTMYCDGLHARSIDSAYHPSREWISALHGRIAHDIPKGWRICGENLYAVHSIPYFNLPSYFMVFSVWNGNFCLPWDETLEWVELLELKHVPILYDGIWDENIFRLFPPSNRSEGYVVRIADGFKLDNFNKCVAKYVRENHVQTDDSWMTKPVVKNNLVYQRE